MTQILVVEDQPVYSSLLTKILALPDYSLVVVGSLGKALQAIQQQPVDIVLLDLGLPDSSGLDTYIQIHSLFPHIPVIILTGLEDENLASKAIHLGAQDYLVKGPYLMQGEVVRSLLHRAIRYAIERHQIQTELKRERDLLESRIAERTADLRDVIEQLRDNTRRLEILQDCVRTTLEEQSMQSIAQIALQRFWQLVPYDFAEVFSINQEENVFKLVTWYPSERDGMEDLNSSDIFYEGIFTTGAYHLNLDLRLSNQTRFEQWLFQQGFLACCLIPLIAKGKMIGVISCATLFPQVFVEKNIQSALELSRQLALVIYNAQLFETSQESNQRLSHLAARLVSAQEDERRRISLELHDEAGQALTALSLGLASLKHDLSSAPSTNNTSLDDLADLTKSLMGQIRNMAHQLHPPELKAVGLNQAISDYCLRIRRQTKMKVSFQPQEVPGLPDHIQITLYRILQEAFTNIVKHAKASSTKVQLGFKQGMIVFSIKDNGVGMDHADQIMKHSGQGLGLSGMQERLEALGGELAIETQPGQGMLLRATIPLEVRT